jgi:uncharacterized RDD family membrane protein YckC
MINWWYIENNRKMGPVSESELLSLFSDGKIGLATLLWRAGLEAWTPLEKIPELDDIRAEEPPPIPFAEDLIVISEGSQKEHAPVPERRVERTPIWSRYFARQFDIMWESILIIFLAASIFTFLNPSFSDWVSKDSNDYLFAFLVFPFVFVFDAGIYRLFGNTPGKALNGIKISTVEGNALSFSQYLSRNFVVWVQVACGIPLVCFIPMYLQSRRLRNGQKASQDETDGYNVVRIMPRPLSRVCFVLAYLGVAMIFGIMNEIDKSQSNSVTTTDSGSPLNSPIPSYSWTNPQTNSVVTIDGSWTYETKQNNQNENYYEFSNSQGSIVVVFGNEIESEGNPPVFNGAIW